MKRRSSFVTNSSSCSYILRFKSNEDKESVVDRFLTAYKDTRPWVRDETQATRNVTEAEAKEYIARGLSVLAAGLFEMTADTSMHNSFYEGVPPWLTEMIMSMLTHNGGYAIDNHLEFISFDRTEN